MNGRDRILIERTDLGLTYLGNRAGELNKPIQATQLVRGELGTRSAIAGNLTTLPNDSALCRIFFKGVTLPRCIAHLFE